jgi:hypothetical protein
MYDVFYAHTYVIAVTPAKQCATPISAYTLSATHPLATPPTGKSDFTLDYRLQHTHAYYDEPSMKNSC